MKKGNFQIMTSYGTLLWIELIWTYSIIRCSSLSESESIRLLPLTREAPFIIPGTTEIILELGADYLLKCESNEPIIWRSKLDLELDSFPYNSSYDDSNKRYGSKLHLTNVTGEFVGFFYCINQNEFIEDGDYDILVENSKAAKIYVFVNDTKVLLVPIKYHVIIAWQDENTVIPCKPTMPEIVVELITDDQEVLSSETFSDYDPKRGFTLQIQGIYQMGAYTCQPQQPLWLNESEKFDFFVLYEEKENIGLEFIKTTRVPMPEIHSDFNGHAVEGETFNLTCSVETSKNHSYIITWDTPVEDNSYRMSYKYFENDSNIGNILTVTNAQRTDEGFYKCTVQDPSDSRNKVRNTYLMAILKSGESYINMSEPNNYYTIKTNASKNIMMNVNYRGFPMPTFNWYAPEGKLIQPSKKYVINETSSNSISLLINSVELFDTGDYVLKASNGVDKKELKFSLYVKAKPQVSIENVYVQAGQQARLLCKTHAFPIAKIIWNYTACNISPKWPSCKNEPVAFNSTRNSSETSKIERVNELIFRPDRPGKMQCTAINEQGISSNEGYVLIGDITDNMTVYGVDENIQIAKGDEVIITCAALAYYYSADLDWFKDNQMITNGSGVEIKTTFSDYSYKKTIKFKNIEDEHAGSYECRARKVESDVDYDSKFLSIIVYESSAPVFVQTNLKVQYNRKLGDSFEFLCKAQGLPKPIITWYRDDEKLNSSNSTVIMEDSSILKIPYIKPADQGLYKCLASNRLGNVQSTSRLKITNMPDLKLKWKITIVIFVGLLIISIVYLGIRIWNGRDAIYQMNLAGLQNFEKGALEQINPAMPLDEQADLLPYDRRFEFPRNKLKLGKQLGAGAFGVVLKARAEGIIAEEKETVVAVKMVKRTADKEVIKALVSELKIMVHLGQHLNVVNLLGAVTKNIAEREIMVIVEYCPFGNVQHFLLQNRKRFTNQINPHTDKIDPTIVNRRLSTIDFELKRDSTISQRAEVRVEHLNSIYSSGMYDFNKYENHVDDVLTDIPEDQLSSSYSFRSERQSNNFKSDLSNPMSITTSDLVSWAFQVTRGMDYLSSRKVLHGDLAARNILLCEDNVVKICDFGLARSMYKNENYKKQHKALLPIKWLALESISDQVFNTYTDVWSFGIMLWEFFSLATVPYPGIYANQTLYLKLRNGYRMEKPPYANQELYDIMLECWSFNPESRPLFHELEKKFARLLGEEVTNHYVDLNEPYLKINNELMQQSGRDYLALMGSPNELAPPPPRFYVNGNVLLELQKEPSVGTFLK